MIANNPSAGRVIRNNHYYIDDMKLENTDFRFDPEFPVKSSIVTDILSSSKLLPLKLLDSSDSMVGPGIFIPEIANSEDVIRRTSEIDKDTLTVGGSDFFKALLEARGLKTVKKHKIDKTNTKQRRFFVFASTSEQSRNSVMRLKKSGLPVCTIPCTLLDASSLTEDCRQKWVSDILTALRFHGTVVSAVGHPINREPGFSHVLNTFMIHMISNVLQSEELDEIIVEGGATASHLVRYLQWKKFSPSWEYSTGVVKLKIKERPGLRLIIKPGSYSWPDKLINND
jgi:uncharacterized protein YgbK (DUF1537 family)